MPRALAITGLLLATAACGGGDHAAVEGSVFPEPVERVTPTPDAASRGQSAVAVELRADGVTIAEQGPGARNAIPLAFGMDRTRLIAALSTVLGPPKLDAREDCGAGPMTFADFGSFTANIQDGTFAGYTATMDDGVRYTLASFDPANQTLAQLKARVGAEPVESTLENEIVMQTGGGAGIGGFLDREGDDAGLRMVYAGATCFYR